MHYLELQRSMMFSQWVELKQMIQTTDDVINDFKRNQALVWEDVFTLAEGTKKMRDLRSNWQDRWNFDRQASTYDQQVKMVTDFNVHEGYEEALELKHEMITQIEDEYFADRSRLIRWFEEHDYVTKQKQINQILHIVLAVPLR